MKNHLFTLIYVLFILVLVSCNKADPNPELKDAIYLDLQAQAGATTRELAEAEKTLKEHEETLKNVTPQTGQIKYAQKRYFEAERAVEKLRQQEKYFKIRIDERLKYVRKKYLDSLKTGAVWPDQKEVDEYMSEKRLRQAKLQWDVRERLEQAKNQKKAEPQSGK